MMNKELFTSNKQNWETPKELFDKLNSEFNFELDAAASDENHKCENYFTEEQNALEQDWSKYNSIFINPPYDSKLQTDFLKKAYETNKKHGTTIVLLIPSRTDTARWHEYIFDKADVRFLRGRIKFEVDGVPHKDPAPFPSAIIIYK